MSDQRARDLEREWKQTGTVEAEAGYLLERVRAGELPRERLELAAYCGNEAACVATRSAAPPYTLDPRIWIMGLARGRTVVAWRAALAVLAAAPHAADRVLDLGVDSPTPEELIRVVSEWLLAPERTLDCTIPMHGWPVERPLREPPVWLEALAIIGDATHSLGGDSALGLIRQELTNWALGLADRVRERLDRTADSSG